MPSGKKINNTDIHTGIQAHIFKAYIIAFSFLWRHFEPIK